MASLILLHFHQTVHLAAPLKIHFLLNTVVFCADLSCVVFRYQLHTVDDCRVTIRNKPGTVCDVVSRQQELVFVVVAFLL